LYPSPVSASSKLTTDFLPTHDPTLNRRTEQWPIVGKRLLFDCVELLLQIVGVFSLAAMTFLMIVITWIKDNDEVD
jgi:hypothetical protein